MTTKIFSVVLIFAVACNANTSTSDNQHTEQTASAVSEATQSASTQPVPLPDMVFDMEHFGENEIRNDHPLSAAEIEQLQIEEIDRPLYQDDLSDFKYYVLKELYNGKEGKIILISRTSEMESFAWLASYDTQGKWIDSKTVFYDEWAESAVSNTSLISDNKITISQYMLDFETEQENTKVNTFYINKGLKFVADNP